MLSLLQDRVLMALCISLFLFSVGQSLYSSTGVISESGFILLPEETHFQFSCSRQFFFPRDYSEMMQLSVVHQLNLLTCFSSSRWLPPSGVLGGHGAELWGE